MVSLPYPPAAGPLDARLRLIGFQTEEWLESFRHYVERELGGTVDADGTIHVGDRSVQAAAFPIGIDVDEFAKRGDSAERRATPSSGCATAPRASTSIIGVDRLDYSKGLDERFLGYRRFLEEHDDCRGKVFLLQIAPPSRGEVHTYEDIREQLDELSGPDQRRVRRGRLGADPLRQPGLSARGSGRLLPRRRRSRLITPLRDGMNLVAKEYVAAQDPDDPGVLILSRFAGAALPAEGRAAGQSLQQGRDQRRHPPGARHAEGRAHAPLGALIDGVRNEDVVAWRQAFVGALTGQTKPTSAPQDTMLA